MFRHGEPKYNSFQFEYFHVDILTWSKTSLFAVIKLRLQVFTADSLNIISLEFRGPLVCISTLRYNKDVRGEKS